jgi:O-antigen ligase
LAAAVFAFGLGSSGVAELLEFGRAVRWVALVILCALALAAALVARGRPGLRGSVALWLAVATVSFAGLSAAWSVRPPLTLGRAASLALLLLTAVALTRAADAEAVLWGLLGGAAALAVAGIVVLAFDVDAAVIGATTENGARYRGLGQNPNTIALVLALATPLALWAALESRSTQRRVVGLGAFALLIGSIGAAGSRGALVAAFAGCVFLVLATPRPIRATVTVGGALAATFAVALLATQLPDPKPALATEPGRTAAPSPPLLDGELGSDDPVFRRSLLTSSGRADAWQGAIDQALDRPVLGYGFGTEERVFVDRYRFFNAMWPENSYIGALLQLGAIGAALLVALIGSVILTGARVARRDAAAAAATAVVVAGGIGALVQSYVWSVGNVATGSLWIAAALAVSLGTRR